MRDTREGGYTNMKISTSETRQVFQTSIVSILVDFGFAAKEALPQDRQKNMEAKALNKLQDLIIH